MRKFKRELWKAGGALALLLFLVGMLWVPMEASAAQQSISKLNMPGTVTPAAEPTEDATVTALNKEQLTRQVAGQQHTLGNWLWENAATILSSLLSILVIVIGALFGLWRWRSDRRDAQDKELKDRESERENRAEERFQAAVTGLGDEKEGARIGAAILLRTFLRPGYEQFYTQTFDLAAANLRLLRSASPPEDLHQIELYRTLQWLQAAQEPEDPDTALPPTPLSQALGVVFKETFPLARNQNKSYPQSLDATGVQLDSVHLRGADLHRAWMPEASLQRADLSNANLSEANLKDAKLNNADLKDAKLNNADLSLASCRNVNLWKADLSHATLNMANLHHAQLHLADLSLAQLNSAYLRRAYLFKADLTDACLIRADLGGACLIAANLTNAFLLNAFLVGAKFKDADLSGAILSGAILNDTNIEEARSLKGANFYEVKGLTQEQRTSCEAKGADFDTDPIPPSSLYPIEDVLPLQIIHLQASSAPSAQGSAPPPGPDGSNTASIHQAPEL